MFVKGGFEMPWRLASFLALLVVITCFIGFNLDNRCDVSVVVHTFESVPIFISLLVAYIAGALTLIPFFLKPRKKDPLAKKGDEV
jgi:hypothetical protein